ncbi:MAG: IS21 family transposase [Acidimicrobiia bacterium]|nr:IS21 family transposase [Acidimicrobiia bacterium]
MMTQGEFMDVTRLQAEGLTIKEIAAKLGYHPATVSKWLTTGAPPAARVKTDESRVMDAYWRGRVDTILQKKPRLLSTSIFDRLVAEGFEGSYPTVVRYVRHVRGPRFKGAAASSIPIETGPAEETQMDWSDCTEWAIRWGWDHELFCLGCVLCWSRWRTVWFASSLDRQHTFEGMVRFFEAAGGVPRGVRIDRMGALGKSQGRRFSLHPPTVEFATHHQIEVIPCLSGDAARKGKVERPFRHYKETFLEEIELDGPPADLDELNHRAGVWLERRVYRVAHRTTRVPPAERFEVEQRMLRPLPASRFDTAYVDVRKVHRNVPLIEYGAVRYSVPPDLLGQAVEVRRQVDSTMFVVRWAGTVVATHQVAAKGTVEVWDPEHRRAAERAALVRRRRPPGLSGCLCKWCGSGSCV